MRIVVHDGAGVIGGNKIFLEDGATQLLLDFGINYAQMGRYFEEFLRPRPGRGLTDLLPLGLLPPLRGLYRSDLFPSDFPASEVLTGEEVHPEAVLLTHAHMDHAGMLGTLRTDLPIVATPMTAVLLKAIQDASREEFFVETTYALPRGPASADPRVLESGDWRRVENVQRPYLAAGAVSDEAARFWGTPASSRRLENRPLVPLGERVGGLRVRCFPLDHSIPGSCGYAVETSEGWVAYTGDIRLHGALGARSLDFARAIAKLRPRVLLVEGTNASGEGAPPPEGPVSEAEVYENCLAVVRRSAGKLVIADFGARNVERLVAFHGIARESGRTLVVLAKDAHLLQAARSVDPQLPDLLHDPHLAVYRDLRTRFELWERGVRETAGLRFVDPEEVRRDPGHALLAMSFWDMNRLLDIRPAGGVYLYSSTEAFNEEMEADVRRLSHWLALFGIEPIGFKVGERGEPIFEPGFHASGHAAAGDLLAVVKEIGAQVVVPIHTMHPEFFVERLKGEPSRVVVPERGRPVRWSDRNPD